MGSEWLGVWETLAVIMAKVSRFRFPKIV